MSEFSIGQKVDWVSAANGSWKSKSGVIVEVVAAGAKIDPSHESYGLRGYGIPRNHVSYVVHVDGATKKSKGKRFWPRAAALREARK